MARPKKGWPLLTYEKHLMTKIGEFLYYTSFPENSGLRRKNF